MASTEPVIFITGKLVFCAKLLAGFGASTEPVIFITGKVYFEPVAPRTHSASTEPVIFITGKRATTRGGRHGLLGASTEPVIFITGKACGVGAVARQTPAFNGAGDLHHRKAPA